MDETNQTSALEPASPVSLVIAQSDDSDQAPKRHFPSTHSTQDNVDQGRTGHKQSLEAETCFMPHKMLMQTAISVEYSTDSIASPIIIHEEILRCHSALFSQNCEKAKILRHHYADCRRLQNELVSHLYPEVTLEQFENERLERKVIPLIVDISTKYPLKGYQRAIKETIDKAVDNEVGQKNLKPATSVTGPGNTKRKEARDMSHAASLESRLGFLKSRGVRTVAEHLYARLHRIDKQEKARAQNNTLAAVAQNRILLPDTDGTTVQLLVQWIYNGTLDAHDANQTYALMSLAKKMGVEVLRELCLSTLTSGLLATLQAAHVAGLPLARQLGFGLDSLDSPDPLLDLIFQKVFLEEEPPKRLKELVVNAIADDLDMELWNHLKSTLSHALALQLIEAMVLRGQIKIEQAKGHVKKEGDDSETA